MFSSFYSLLIFQIIMLRWPLCGPKLSLCFSVISVWGIVQFLLLGIFFFSQSAPLLDDFEFEHETTDATLFKDRLKEAYNQRAYNCWIAAFLYVGLLVFAGSQFMTNQKQFGASAMPGSIASPFAGVTTEENGQHRQYGMQLTDE